MSQIKTYLSITLCFLWCYSALAQTEFNAKVIEMANETPLANAFIINTKTKDTLISNKNGNFNITDFGSYLLQKPGYFSKTVQFSQNDYRIVSLQINPQQLGEVVINTNHVPKPLKKATAAINIVTSKDIERANNINFSPVLNRVPGVFMQSGTLSTNRIVIRGIGSRTLYGTSKIRAYFKDIPLTNGSGETNIEDFELGSISSFEIIKGAVSSIYGAGLGGTIHLKPESATFNQTSFSTELTLGSFGLVKSLNELNYGASKSNYKMVYSHTESDGYRDNNNYNRETLTLNSNHYLGEKDELSFLGSYVDLKAFIPSSINASDFENRPKTAALNWKQAQGYEAAKRGIFGLSWKHQYSSSLNQNTSIFTSFRDAYEPRPFNILTENSFAFGIRTRLLGDIKLLEKDLNWTLGAEVFREHYRSKTFENLYEAFPIGTGSVQGAKASDFKEKRDYYNLFFEGNYEFSEATTLSVGLNMNQTGYDLTDDFAVSEENPDQSGNFQFKTILSPKFGVSHLFSEAISAFASISHGFSPISSAETLLPDGQINTQLKPETGWNFELGTRGTSLDNRLNYSLNIYRLDVKNLLVARRVGQDQYIGVNAGRTQHDGLELSAEYQWFQSADFTLSSFANYSLNHYKFKEFIDDGQNFSGNELTGVPNGIFNAGVDVTSKIGFYGNINFQQVGKMPITDSNNLYSNAYSLTNLKIGYAPKLSEQLQLNLFFGLNNIFDTAYASQILINANSFGNAAPRYYYPGEPSNYFSGISLNYVF
jgi:iron complex outermembrane receptor protein